KKQRARTGILPAQDLTQDLLRVIAAIGILFGTMFALGGFLLLQSTTGFISLIVAVTSGFWLRQLNKHQRISMPKPGLE
ncbi:MAG: sodium:proline symporter, partial [Cyanobacteria bacterium P01_C01_bin.72]